MRTTVTLDDDVERLLRESMLRTRRSFKESLNQALRAGLQAERPAAPEPPFVVRAWPLGLRPSVDPDRLNQLADELETEALLDRMHAAAGRARPGLRPKRRGQTG